MLDQHQQHGHKSFVHEQQPQKQTLESLINSIDFVKKNKAKSTISISDADSISSGHSVDTKEKSKVWTEEEIEIFHILLKKYGTDFHILSSFFPKKTKNQLKNRYKQYSNMQKKREKFENSKLKAVSELFKEVDQKQQKEYWGEKQKEEQNLMKEC